MNRIAILVPSEALMEGLLALVDGAVKRESVGGHAIARGTLESGKSFVIVVTGMGRVNAGAAAAIACLGEPDLLLSLNWCLATSEIRAGEVVLATEYLYGDVDNSVFGFAEGQIPYERPLWVCDEQLNDALEKALKAKTYRGRLASAEAPKERLPKKPALAYDVDGAAIVQVCNQFQIPCAAVRYAMQDYSATNTSAATDFFDLQLPRYLSSLV